MTKTDIPPISRVLRANSRFSLASGLLLAAGSPWLDDLLGPPSWILAVVGAGVLGFGVLVDHGSMRTPRDTGRAVMWADVAWVVATVALAPLVAPHFTSAGGVAAWAIAAVVAGFAVAEWRTLRR